MTLDAAAKYTMTVADYSGVRARVAGPRRLRRDGEPGRPPDADRRRAGRFVGRVLLGRQVRGDDRLHPAGLGDRPARPLRHRHRPRLQLARRLQRRGADGSVRRPGGHGRHGQRHGDDLVDHPAHDRAEPGADGVRSPTPATAPTATSTARTRATPTAPSSRTPGTSATAARRPARPRATTSCTSGTRDVTLTVTDDEGTTGSLVIPVSVVRTNAAPDGVVHDELHLPRLHASTRPRPATATATSRRTRGTSATARPTPRPVPSPSHTYDPAGAVRRHPHGDRQRQRHGQHDPQRRAGRGPPDRAGGQQRQPGQRVHAQHHRPGGHGGRRPADRWCSASTTPRAPSGRPPA